MKHHKEHHHKKAEGGSIKQEGPHQEATNAKKTEAMEHGDEYKGDKRAEREVKVEKHKGGSMRAKRARGGHIAGKEPKHRLDKRARGGSAKSPLSGADAPNLAYAHGNLKVDQAAKGKTVKAD